MKYKLVCVDWVDSALTIGWKNIDSAEYGISHCRTVGWLVRDDAEEVRVAMSVSDSGAVSEVMCIPRGSVKSIKYVRRPS